MPAVILGLLFKYRHILYDEGSPELTKIEFALGGMYSSYLPEVYFFEVIVIVHKCVMTGAMCVASPGTSLQLMAASLVMLLYLLVVIKLAPYEDPMENWVAYTSNRI
jgi:hypothetical protein